jgi:uncharacterized protein (TIGR02266 family)
MARPVRRRDARLLVNREFRSVDEFVAEYVSNISRSGAFIRTDEPLPVGTRVQLRFTLLLEEIETIEGEGEVVRVVKPSSSRRGGMGVVFTTLSGYSKRLLERLMTRRMTR